MDLPLEEYDPEVDALIAPTLTRMTEPMPERVVMCFFPKEIEALGGRLIGRFSRELGRHSITRVEWDGVPVAVFHPGVGAPLAAQHMEKAIAAGGRRFVACGGAGAVRPGLALGHVVVPDAALRDEGTSFHYAPPSRTIAADPKAVRAAAGVLAAHDVPYTVGTTWTTDAPYRETRGRIQARRDEGCVTVEMEAAAFIAVARFRGVRFAQLLYAGDDVSGESWDHRGWTTSDVRTDLLRLALATATAL